MALKRGRFGQFLACTGYPECKTTRKIITTSGGMSNGHAGKGFDTFCPLGPWIETDFDPSDAMVTCHVNGEMRQMASTRDMVFSVRQIVAFTSTIMTLLPGDILMTGTPAGVGPLTNGDIVDVSIEGIGMLSNPVASEPV